MKDSELDQTAIVQRPRPTAGDLKKMAAASSPEPSSNGHGQTTLSDAEQRPTSRPKGPGPAIRPSKQNNPARPGKPTKTSAPRRLDLSGLRRDLEQLKPPPSKRRATTGSQPLVDPFDGVEPSQRAATATRMAQSTPVPGQKLPGLALPNTTTNSKTNSTRTGSPGQENPPLSRSEVALAMSDTQYAPAPNAGPPGSSAPSGSSVEQPNARRRRDTGRGRYPSVGRRAAERHAAKRRQTGEGTAPYMRTARRPDTRPRAVESSEYWREGALIDDRYEIDSKLGDGSMGSVYLARDSLLRKPVALKVLHPEVATHRGTVQRFRREVALAHSVTHPGVVRIYDAGEAHGLPYLSMEFLGGQTLEQLITQINQGGVPLSFREVREILSDILGGLTAVHRAGIVHRDLKPANILLTERGAVVMDFGVAGWSSVLESSTDRHQPDSLVRTEAGTILGSPAYMAPELWDRNPATVQSDLYALGVIAYQLLTGQLPYDASDARNYLYQMRTRPPVPIKSHRRDVPWSLAHFVARNMASDPDRRPSSANAAARWIRPFHHRRKLISGFALLSAAAVAGTVWWKTQTPDHEKLGIHDPMVAMDFRAAVRSYDIGDYETATRQFDRIAKLEPNSAGITYMRSVIAQELHDGDAHEEACLAGEWEGSESWRVMAQASCDGEYETSADEKNLLAGRSTRFDISVLPRIVHAKLAPQIEVARHIHPGLRGEIDTANQLLAEEPNWNSAVLPIPTRWALAQVDMLAANGKLDLARSRLDILHAENPTSPIVSSRLSRLAALRGELELARQLADEVEDTDPRAILGVWLDTGRLEHAWKKIEEWRGSAYRSALIDSWCGYAARYGHSQLDQRCSDLDPGLTRLLVDPRRQPATEADLATMNAVERIIWSAQLDLHFRRCVPGRSRPAVLTHARPPFETYLRQLEIGLNLCASRSERGHFSQARTLLDELIGVTPDDAFAILARSKLDYARGRKRAALSDSRQVAEIWRHADPNLSVVATLRSQVVRDQKEQNLIGGQPGAPLEEPDNKNTPKLAHADPSDNHAAAPNDGASSDGTVVGDGTTFEVDFEDEPVAGSPNTTKPATKRNTSKKRRSAPGQSPPQEPRKRGRTRGRADDDAAEPAGTEPESGEQLELPDLIDDPTRVDPWSPPVHPSRPEGRAPDRNPNPEPRLNHNKPATNSGADPAHLLGRAPQPQNPGAPGQAESRKGTGSGATNSAFRAPMGHGKVAPPP